MASICAMPSVAAAEISLGNPHCLVYCWTEAIGQFSYCLDAMEQGKSYAMVWADGEDRAAVPVFGATELDDLQPVITYGTADSSWVESLEIWNESDFRGRKDVGFRGVETPCSDNCTEYDGDRKWIIAKIRKTTACKAPGSFKLGLQGFSDMREFYVIPASWSAKKASDYIAKNVAVPATWKKARTLSGVATRATDAQIVGLFELKCGKANKKGVSKVSATLTGLDGKKSSYKAKDVDVTGDVATVAFGNLVITIDGESFEGDDGLAGGLSVSSSNASRSLPDGEHLFSLVDFNFDVPGELQWDFIPIGDNAEAFTSNGGKWKFAKSASFKVWQTEACCGMTSMATVTADLSKGSNLSGLKLTYSAKNGMFKGSFSVYSLQTAKGKNKLKKYSIKVVGLVINGQGIGQATCKKPAGGPWTVQVQ